MSHSDFIMWRESIENVQRQKRWTRVERKWTALGIVVALASLLTSLVGLVR